MIIFGINFFDDIQAAIMPIISIKKVAKKSLEFGMY